MKKNNWTGRITEAHIPNKMFQKGPMRKQYDWSNIAMCYCLNVLPLVPLSIYIYITI